MVEPYRAVKGKKGPPAMKGKKGPVMKGKKKGKGMSEAEADALFN